MSIGTMTVCVPIEMSLFVQLYEEGQDKTHLMIQNILSDYLTRIESDGPVRGTGTVGVRWEGLPLPVGTGVRTKYLGNYKNAEVVDGGFFFEGKRYPSAAQVCNAMRGGTQNNAWITLEIRLPGRDWVHAQSLRVGR